MEEFNSTQKASEEVMKRNVLAAIEHGNATRKIARESLDEVKQLKSLVCQQNMKIESLEELLRKLLIDTYSVKPTE